MLKRRIEEQEAMKAKMKRKYDELYGEGAYDREYGTR